MLFSEQPHTALEKCALAFHAYKTHWWQCMSIALLQSVVFLISNKEKAPIYTEAQAAHMGTISWHDAISLSCLIIAIYITTLLFEYLNQNRRQISFNLTTTLYKLLRRLFDVCLAGTAGLLTAALLLLPFFLLALYPHWKQVIQNSMNLLPANSTLMLNSIGFIIIITVVTIIIYSVNRYIYGPIIAAIHTSPGLQCYKASHKITTKQWWRCLTSVWLPTIIVTAVCYNIINTFIADTITVNIITNTLCLPWFACLLIIQIHDMLARQHLTIDCLTEHTPSITKPW